VAFGPKGLPRLDEISVNARVLGFSLGLAVLTGLLFSLAPALHVAGQNIGQMLRESTRGMSGKRGAQRTRGVLVMSEMALAVVLLVGAGLLIRSFINVMRVDLGFRPEHVVTLNASLPGAAYPWDSEQLQFVNGTLERVRALPGVTDAALAFGRPLQAAGIRNTFEVEGWPPSTPQRRHIADVRMVTPGFFHTLGIPVVRGRGLLPSDGPSAPAVVLVSQAFVQQYFPNDNPIGKRVWLGWNRSRSADPKDTVTAGGTIVGVVGDIKARSLTQPAPAILYAPLAQFPFSELSILARSNGAPEATIRAVRAVLREFAPGVALYNAQPMTDVVSDSVAQARFYTMLLTAFAVVALVLAALGIYGVISYSVGQRTREIGIRIALGATQPRVVRFVVTQGLGLTIAGIVIGLFGARQLTRVLGSLLFNVPPADRFTYAAVALLLTGVAWMASYVPARRAARVDPVFAMRAE
jgi:putative ABC transport system permease protein